MKRLLKNTANPIKTVASFLQLLNIDVSTRFIKEKLEMHPDYPSILSLGDIIEDLNQNVNIIEVSNVTLKDLPSPFITLINSNRGDQYVCVKSISGNSIVYYFNGKKVSEDVSVFTSKWKSIVMLVVSKSAYTEDSDFKKEKVVQRLQILLSSLATISLVFYGVKSFMHFGNIEFNVIKYFVSFILLSSVGVFLTVLLVGYDRDSQGLLKTVCGISKKVNCSAVLSSRYSSLFGIIPWSNVGLSYFVGSILFAILIGNKNAGVTLISIMSVLSFPYVIYSLFYQWKIIKSWCPLCLAIQLILLIEASLGVRYIYANVAIYHTRFFEYELIPFCYLLPLVILQVIDKLEKRIIVYKSKVSELNRMKYDSYLFEQLLLNQSKISMPRPLLGFQLGDKNSVNELLIVCSPYCGPCARTHSVINRLLKVRSNLSVRIIFTASEQLDDPKNDPIKHFLALRNSRELGFVEKIISDWYLKVRMRYAKYKKIYETYNFTKSDEEEIKEMAHWCKEAKIKFTPTIFFRGYQLPDFYQSEDLKYLIN